MTTLLSYHNDEALKTEYLDRVKAHQEADQLVQGYAYWKDGKGCAVGCTIHSSDHMSYESLIGVPVMLARLEDSIFEGLPVERARLWPGEFLGAIPIGKDLSRVGWQFVYWLLTTQEVNPGINHDLVREAIQQCAAVIEPMTRGLPADVSAAMSARSAARSAESAAMSAAESAAMSAMSAAMSARSAAYVLMADKLIELLKGA